MCLTTAHMYRGVYEAMNFIDGDKVSQQSGDF